EQVDLDGLDLGRREGLGQVADVDVPVRGRPDVERVGPVGALDPENAVAAQGRGQHGGQKAAVFHRLQAQADDALRLTGHDWLRSGFGFPSALTYGRVRGCSAGPRFFSRFSCPWSPGGASWAQSGPGCGGRT